MGTDKTLFLCEVHVWRFCAGESVHRLPDGGLTRSIPEDPRVVVPDTDDHVRVDLEDSRLAEDVVVVSYDFLGNPLASEEFVDLIDAYGDDLHGVLDRCTPGIVEVADSEWLRSKLPQTDRLSVFDFGKPPEVRAERVRTCARLTCLFELEVSWSQDWESGHHEADGEFRFLGVVPWEAVQAALRGLSASAQPPA